MNWTKQTAIVTGAGRGIGQATALLLNSLGVRVTLIARTKSELEETQSLCTYLENTKIEVGDISNFDFIEYAFTQSLKTWGSISILVNNAAILEVKDFLDISQESLDSIFRVNVMAPFLFSQKAFLKMKESGEGGSIINISSLGGLMGTEKFKGFSVYTMSKFAINGLTESLSVEGKPFGIRVNGIAPGAVNTQMLYKNAPQLKSEVNPSEIAKLVVFLADSSQSNSLNGTTIPVWSNLKEI